MSNWHRDAYEVVKSQATRPLNIHIALDIRVINFQPIRTFYCALGISGLRNDQRTLQRKVKLNKTCLISRRKGDVDESSYFIMSKGISSGFND